MIFAEGDDPRVLRAAVQYQRSGLGKALVVGRDDDVKAKLEAAASAMPSARSKSSTPPIRRISKPTRNFLYDRLQRKGMTVRTFTVWPRVTGMSFPR